MIVGHAPVAFALAAGAAALAGVDRRRAAGYGLVAAAFAVVPDVDMAYAVAGLLGADPSSVWQASEVFWAHSKVVHRAITHSLVLAVPAAVSFALVAGSAPGRVLGGGLAVALFVGAAVVLGPLGGAMMGLYLLAGVAIALVAARAGHDPMGVLGPALVGLLTHPFGDLFTGTPPRLLYPFDVPIVTDRIVLHPDPTLNLLMVFGLELAAIWVAVTVAGALFEYRIVDSVRWPAAVGVAYGATALVLPAPTLEVSYHFVFSVIAVGSVGIGIAPLARRVDADVLVDAAVTGLFAVTLAGVAYTAAYLLLG